MGCMTAPEPCDTLRARVDALEARLAEAERRAGTIAAVQRTWRVVMQARGDLVVATDAGDLARVPVAVARVIAAGRALDVSVEEDGDDVLLVDPRGRVVARLSRAAFLVLPKALAAWARECQSRGSLTAQRPGRGPSTAPGARGNSASPPGTTATAATS